MNEDLYCAHKTYRSCTRTRKRFWIHFILLTVIAGSALSIMLDMNLVGNIGHFYSK